MLDKHENALCAETYRRRMCVFACAKPSQIIFSNIHAATVVDVLSFLIQLKAIAENVMLLLSLFQNVQKILLWNSRLILFAFFNTKH